MDKSRKTFPKWLRESSSVKNLPAIYYGILAQVQVQPSFVNDGLKNGRDASGFFASRLNQKDFMDRYTDTNRVHQLLLTSQLPNETMGHIWAFCNRSFPGKLNNRELCLALSLIAIFQRLEKEKKSLINKVQTKSDPFELIRTEKKPSVPKLYATAQDSSYTLPSASIKAKSAHTDLSTLLVNIEDCQEIDSLNSTNISNNPNNYYNDEYSIQCEQGLRFSARIYLLDIDCDMFATNLSRQCQVWRAILEAMQSLFKRTFDIFNVEHSKVGALEALSSQAGREFSLNLTSCYPIAYNIKTKIEAVYDTFKLDMLACSDLYLRRTNDLMTSINEYWAVLMNLFHESGSTQVVELVMDGLNYDKNIVLSSKSVEELASELFAKSRQDYCLICHNKRFLPALNETATDTLDNNLNETNSLNKLLLADLGLFELLISDDCQHYYHARCANFWLKQTDSMQLPYLTTVKNDERILSPSKGA